ncbi:hypothetical protein [Geodermatophilus sp. SYSU D00696]
MPPARLDGEVGRRAGQDPVLATTASFRTVSRRARPVSYPPA